MRQLPHERIADANLRRLICARGLAGAEALYDTYSRLITLVVNRIITNEAQAQQIIQVTFIKIFNSIDDYNLDKEKIYTWIVSIAKTVALEAEANRIHETKNKNISARQR